MSAEYLVEPTPSATPRSAATRRSIVAYSVTRARNAEETVTPSRPEPASAADEPESRSTASIWHKLHLDDVTKILALSGSFLYCVLFMAYRAYYEELNLSPEDVGVDPTYVLVRSPGFIVMTLAAVAASIVFLYVILFARRRWLPPLLVAIASSVVGAYIYHAVGYGFGILLYLTVAAVLVMATFFTVFRGRLVRIARYVQVGVIILLGVALPAALLLKAAQSRGEDAARGEVIQAVHVLDIVVLDVSTAPVQVLWSDPRAPHPPYFGDGPEPAAAFGTLLGQTENAIVVNLRLSPNVNSIVRFDPRQVIIGFTSG